MDKVGRVRVEEGEPEEKGIVLAGGDLQDPLAVELNEALLFCALDNICKEFEKLGFALEPRLEKLRLLVEPLAESYGGEVGIHDPTRRASASPN